MIEEITLLGYPKQNDEIIVYSNGKVNLIDKSFTPMRLKNIKSNNEIIFDDTSLF